MPAYCAPGCAAPDAAPLLFALDASRAFAEQAGQAIGLALSAHEVREFEDGEHKARPLVNVRGRDVYVLHSLHGDAVHSANDKLCRLLFFIRVSTVSTRRVPAPKLAGWRRKASFDSSVRGAAAIAVGAALSG